MRRPLAAALLAFALAGCHEDAEVQQVFVPPVPSALGLTASGGNAGATAAVAGQGGSGGDLLCEAVVSLSIGTLTTQPVAPPAPTAPVPTTSDVPLVTGFGDVDVSGNVFASSAITTDDDVAPPLPVVVDGTITIRSDNGDIVVSSTLTAFDPGAGAPVNVHLDAPNGTVWITGTLRTANTDAVLDGDAAGNVTITAARVVITGTIDAQGQSGGTGVGGAGGTVSITASSSYVLLGAGTINVNGGAGGTQGGAGGDVTVVSAQKLNLYGTVTGNGGAASGTATNDVQGGNGGQFAADSALAVDAVGTFSFRGGSATTTGNGAVGGQGGTADVINSPDVPLRLYGSLDVSGGSASAAALGAALDGGPAGVVQLGVGNPLLSIETGVGTYAHNGGTGELQGGFGGTLDFAVAGGQLLLGGTLQAQGGASSGGGGGDGGFVNAAVAGPGILSSSATINVSSGASAGGAAPTAGVIDLATDSGDLTLSGSLVASAGSSSGPVPGNGGSVVALCDQGGSLSCSATVTATGGASTAAGALDGGNGGSLAFTVAHASGSISVTGAVNLDGGASTGAAVAGDGGTFTLNTVDDFISVGASVLARGGASTGGTGGAGGRAILVSDTDLNGVGGDITLAAGFTLDVSGGTGTTGGSAQNAVPGDAVLVEADGNDSNSLLDNGRVNLAGSVLARGGAANGNGGNVFVDGRNAAGTSFAVSVATVSAVGNGTGTAGTVTVAP